MALARTVVSEGLIDELNRFEELVRPLSAEAVGHAEPVRGLDGRRRRPPRHRLDGRRRGRPPRRARVARGDQARGRRARRSLRPPSSPTSAPRSRRPRPGCCRSSTTRHGPAPGPGGFDGTLGDGVEALWYDTWMHAEDIRAALGQKPVMSSGFRAARFARGVGSRAESRAGTARCRRPTTTRTRSSWPQPAAPTARPSAPALPPTSTPADSPPRAGQPTGRSDRRRRAARRR